MLASPDKMKYYIYVSDTKVDMLFPQIPRPIKSKIAAALKIDLQVLELSFQKNPTQETRYSRLNIVANYIRKNEELGTADEPKAYFQGTLPMFWGQHGPPRTEVAYFGAQTVKTTLGLFGSLDHIVGGRPVSGQVITTLGLPFLLDVLREDERSNSAPSTSLSIRRVASSLEVVEQATEQISRQGLPQQLEFLAKRFMEGQIGDKHILLGSPIYIAAAD